VPRSVADAFYAKLKERAQSINIGDPLQPGCRMGPIVSAAQYERVRGYVQVGCNKQRSLHAVR
jgi:betaine-aldehyde dehydrogenase